tara:strand:+ start:1631 stop:3484 length:1854 start_codon:yes stop_codon:yes gene_type:complete
MSNKHAVKEAPASYQSTLAPLGSRELQNFIAGNPLTDNLNLWISATKAKSTSGRGNNKKIELVGIKKLRELILELAVRGKLVPQNQEDEPASELLKKIDAEKAKLIAEGKIKKQKKLPEISEDEKPFELPKGWEWARLGTIASYGNPEKAEANKASSKTWILELEDIEKTTSRLIQKIRFNSREFKSTKNVFKAGDVLYGKLRPYLDKVLVADEPGICTTEIIPISCYGGLSPQYLRCYLKSPRFIFYANTSTHGMNLPRLGTDKAITSVVSIPPLEEQHCIVAKVDELMALCDQLEQHSEHQLDAHKQLVETLLATLVESENSDDLATNWQRLAEHFDTLFSGALTSTTGIGNGGGEWAIDRLKDTILQLAVMGKLVPQNPDDEPASELLKRIDAEKAKLFQEGMKTKASDMLKNEELYIQTPSNWQWMRLGNLAKFIDYRGKTPTKINSGIRLITAKNIRKGYIDKNPEEFISESDYDTWMTRGFPRIGDMLFTTEAPMGNAATIDLKDKFALAQRAICFQWHVPTVSKFMLLQVLAMPFQSQLLDQATGMTATGIKASKLKEIPVALPPVSEQHRIVAKVDELFALCDQLKSRLQAASETQLTLTEALVEQALN